MIVTPLLLFMLLLIVQFAVYMHALHIAQAAAAEALAVARADDSTAAAGHAQADVVLSQLGRSVLTQPRVVVERGPSGARVEVTGTAETVVPFLRLPVHAVAAGPLEEFTADPGGPGGGGGG